MLFLFKLHLVFSSEGNLIAFKVRKNINDVQVAYPLLSKLQGLAFRNKGYIGKKLSGSPMRYGLKLITKNCKNMENRNPITRSEKQLLDQRSIIETVFNHLRHHYQFGILDTDLLLMPYLIYLQHLLLTLLNLLKYLD